MKKILTILLAMILIQTCFGQKKIKVLFIGNSYTSVNNLPNTVAQIAAAKGDTLIYDSSTPGGYTFQQQSTYAPTLAKIAQGGWDYVVLQAQSQEPSFPPSQVQADTYPYATTLDSLIHVADSCTETVFYLTWGKKNGDSANCASYPAICTYAGCQDRLSQSYLEMAQMNHATVSPAGEAWRKIIADSLSFDLFQSDQSHPTIFGTYLTASVFYEILFQKSVLGDSFRTAGIPDSNARQLLTAAHSTVFDSINKWTGYGHRPSASFNYNVTGGQVSFTSTSIDQASLHWDFGDGNSGNGVNIAHQYTSSGTYMVVLTDHDHCKDSRDIQMVTVALPSGINDESSTAVKIYPDPANSELHVRVTAELSLNGYALTITNSSGQLVKKLNAQNEDMTINVNDMVDGIYTLTFKHGLTEKSYQMLIKH